MVTIRVVMADCDHPQPSSASALARAQAAARRFPDRVRVVTVPLDDPPLQDLGIGLAPTVLVEDLVVAVGAAPPAGHLVRAIEAALAKEDQS